MGWIFSEWCKSTARLDGKTAIITGCNSGIGKETVREFYKRGGKIIMACRNLQKAEEAARDIRESSKDLSNVGQLNIKELDLSSFDSIRKCAQEILDTEPAIHILVNNAGILTPLKLLSKDGYELHFAINHLGHFLFTLLLLPKIIQSAPARIIVVSSCSYQLGENYMHLDDINLDQCYNFYKAYSRSKLANIYFAIELANRLKKTGVNVYSLDPGFVYTDIGQHFETIYPRAMSIIKPIGTLFVKTAIQGAQTILYCSLDEKCANETRLYYKECAVKKLYLQPGSEDNAKALWEKSIELVKLEDYDLLNIITEK